MLVSTNGLDLFSNVFSLLLKSTNSYKTYYFAFYKEFFFIILTLFFLKLGKDTEWMSTGHKKFTKCAKRILDWKREEGYNIKKLCRGDKEGGGKEHNQNTILTLYKTFDINLV